MTMFVIMRQALGLGLFFETTIVALVEIDGFLIVVLFMSETKRLMTYVKSLYELLL